MSDPIPGEGVLTEAQIDERLHQFEQKYGVRSADFYALWLHNPDLDTFDLNYWAALIRLVGEAE